MPKTSVQNTLTDAAKIVQVWTANPTFAMGDITRAQFEAAMSRADAADNAVDAKRVELTALMDARDDAALAVSKLTVRARSAIKGVFGPDSAQYDQAGGTRDSERKASTPAAKPPKPA